MNKYSKNILSVYLMPLLILNNNEKKNHVYCMGTHFNNYFILFGSCCYSGNRIISSVKIQLSIKFLRIQPGDRLTDRQTKRLIMKKRNPPPFGNSFEKRIPFK